MQPRAITREIGFITDRGVKVNLEGNIMKKRTVQNNGKTKEKKKLGPTDNLKPSKPGQGGNPGGRPKRDLASEVAQAVFEGNEEAIYKAMLKALLKGDPEVFAVLADRAFGKCSQRVEIPGIERG